jgi:sugar lactone lactonase YvrE
VRAPKAGGDPTPVAKVPGSKIQQLAADDGAVYWTDSGTGDPTWSGRVKRASLADGKVDTLSDAPSPLAIAVDADTVYWTSSADAGGRILAQKKTGGATFVLATDLRKPRGLAVDGKYVYWVSTGDGSVCRTEKTPHAKP